MKEGNEILSGFTGKKGNYEKDWNCIILAYSKFKDHKSGPAEVIAHMRICKEIENEILNGERSNVFDLLVEGIRKIKADVKA